MNHLVLELHGVKYLSQVSELMNTVSDDEKGNR